MVKKVLFLNLKEQILQLKLERYSSSNIEDYLKLLIIVILEMEADIEI